MGFNDPNRPKILRTQLKEETLRRFKALAARHGISMADYLEKLVENELQLHDFSTEDHSKSRPENNA